MRGASLPWPNVNVESQRAAATLGRTPARTHMTPAPDGLLEAFKAFCVETIGRFGKVK